MLTLQEVKQWLRLEESDTTEDALLQSLIAAAEDYLRSALASWIDPAKNPPAKVAAMAIIADMYENRSAVIDDPRGAAQASGMRPTIRALIAQLQHAYPHVETASLPDATVGQAYEAALQASGGSPPYAWQVIDGTLPAGLALDEPTGAIIGTPTEAGRRVVTVEVRDVAGRSASRPVAITVVAAS